MINAIATQTEEGIKIVIWDLQHILLCQDHPVLETTFLWVV